MLEALQSSSESIKFETPRHTYIIYQPELKNK